MVLGVMKGQIRRGYFPDYILDPSVIDCNVPLEDPHLHLTCAVVPHIKALLHMGRKLCL